MTRMKAERSQDNLGFKFFPGCSVASIIGRFYPIIRILIFDDASVGHNAIFFYALFQLHDEQRQSVNEQHHIRAFGTFANLNGMVKTTNPAPQINSSTYAKLSLI
ncbi:hypothetical protein GF337_04005 [candidate division KSB1 bacterium]|nr:hypothetical protein [candidate division KSB1 bacterium]